MGWIKDIIAPQTRKWEEFYRNRFQHDRVVRSTHGVNCTGGCSWSIHVKDGIVAWETQALDYPLLENSLPGGVERAAGTSVAKGVGTELDLTGTYRAGSRVVVLAGYSLLWAGDFIRQTGAARNIGFAYCSLQITY